MKSIVFACLLVVAVSAADNSSEVNAAKFLAFKAEHGKTYSNQVEEATRYNIFKSNLEDIEEHNALYAQGLVTYNKTINRFSDLTIDEFRSFLTLHTKPTLKNASPYVKLGVDTARSVDWRSRGYVTGIKDQGNCGSCWAFSITGSTEGAYYKAHGSLISFSEQQLIDCSTKINYGCSGGYLEDTFTYVEKYGLEAESTYRYTGTDGSCEYSDSDVVTKVNSYKVIKGDEDALLEAVATVGPVSVGMDARYLSSYSSGIYQSRDCSSEALNHAVLVVGYGVSGRTKYWIVKNSWGQSWGESGYFNLLRGSNECGVAKDNTYPIIN